MRTLTFNNFTTGTKTVRLTRHDNDWSDLEQIENSSFRTFSFCRAIFLSSSGPISLVRLQYNKWYEGSEEKESELAKVGWLLRRRWVEKYLGSLEMQLLPRLPVTGRGTSLHHLTHYQVINLDSCWTCPAWLPRKWLHFKSKLTRAQCSDLGTVSRKKMAVLLDFVQMRGGRALPKFFVRFSQTVYIGSI